MKNPRIKHIEELISDMHEEMQRLINEFNTLPELQLNPIQREKFARIIELNGQILDCTFECIDLRIRGV